ncbi:MAG TPA: N-6 DNA methylase [Candidatus Acidoferrum sp.]|jgi:hypothetical protein|nr:N-6 DNA methylase [Candidatus Acidoferrum sp.]
MASFPSIRIEGGLLSSDLLDELCAGELNGQKPADFGLDPKRNLTDEIAGVFADARALWGVFQNRLAKIPRDDPATSVTRDAWLIPFLGLLGYELQFNARAYEADGQSFAISHRAGHAEDAPPIHLVGNRQELGRVAASGRPRLSPHSLLQEYLNRTDHVWGLVSNGNVLRVLRDSTFVRRQSYIEFDLQSVIEEQRFTDFTALYRLIHRTRLPKRIADAPQCLIEQYYQHSEEQGGRVRDHLRDGVERCILNLANGFLRHPANEELRRRASPECTGNERLSPEELFRQLLRLVYRFLFLLVSEERGLLSPDPVYRENYGIVRLRTLLDQRSAFSDYEDLAHSLGVLWEVFRNPKHAELLQLAPLNGDLFDPQLLDSCSITNRDLLTAFWNLSYYREKPAAPPRRVNYAALDVEELGSIYESLLEFHPAVTRDSDGRLQFDLVFGSERKTTGSYYTPPELVGELIKSALEPVIEQRLAAARQNGAAAEKALLSIRVCDPACGSGHFLLAAARRIAKELARVRTGEEEPAPERTREAVRDVIAHCIYGVDRNPLAVDLCRVALWLESHTGTKPLTFLDHRIRCGDSLVGVFNLSVLQNGIPDEAFKPVEGDDKQVARAAAKRNREEKQGVQDLLPRHSALDTVDLVRHSRELDAIADDSPELIRRKKQLYDQAHRDPGWLRHKQLCDLWTAAFLQTLAADSVVITSAALADYLSGRPIDARLHATADTLAHRLFFFHWPLEFPEVFVADSPGFDVVLSNPPWERIKLQEQEFFAARDPRIATAPNKAARSNLIEELTEKNPTLHAEFVAAVHAADAASKFLRHSGRYPLTGTGDINTYAVFAETIRRLLAPEGRAGLIVPTGIATDATCQDFFADLNQRGQLATLFDFENRDGLFPAVDSRMKFCLLTLSGKPVSSSQFAFFLTRAEHLRDPRRRFTLSAADLALFNPNTRTCPVFRTRADADLTRAIYERVPVLLREGAPGGNPWGISFLRMLDMSKDSHLFRTREQLLAEGCRLEGNVFLKPDPGSASPERYLPLYEGKMVQAFDHRAASVVTTANIKRPGQPVDVSLAQHQDRTFSPQPQYWVAAHDVERLLPSTYRNRWFLGFKSVTSPTNERTFIAALLPFCGVANSMPLIVTQDQPAALCCCLLGNLNALVYDYVAKQKVGGVNLNFFIVQQLPVLPPTFYRPEDVAYVAARVLELVYTAEDLRPLFDVVRMAHGEWPVGPDHSPLATRHSPFPWDEERRAVLRAELDAWFARAYGLNRKQLRYILDPADLTPRELENILDPWEEVADALDAAGYEKRCRASDFPGETFRVLKEKEIAKFGEHRTRRLVLEAWERLEKHAERGDAETGRGNPETVASQS